MIFDDQFSGNSLDTSKWVTYLGAQGGVWNDHGSLPVPFSGPNTPITTEAAMFLQNRRPEHGRLSRDRSVRPREGHRHHVVVPDPP